MRIAAEYYTSRIIKKMRILGLDVGERRIGIAISDPLNKIALPLSQIERTDKLEETLQKIEEFTLQYRVERIVVGLPRNMKGEEGWEVKKVRSFVSSLLSRINIPLFFIDERFSTVLVERVLKKGKVSFSKRRQVKDKLAAVIILQSYLDSQEFKNEL
ncbi:Holliday junction resolvase RuvX [Candidatus Aerophobetes bacterium]|nr:Holliday junction resolvase RuvX [Candidatus Aerophobetes bacterium]